MVQKQSKTYPNSFRTLYTTLKTTPLWRSKLVWFVAILGAVGIFTALTYLMRGGSLGAVNWPVSYNLTSSDNGVLYQFASDVIHGRHLDWSFSPQVYVFPEIPISLLSYVLAAGSIYNYFLFVAVINNLVLFVSIFVLVKHLIPTESFGQKVARTTLVTGPLILLPLLSMEHVFQYHLFPTYYFGVYMMLFLTPVYLLTRKTWVKVAIGALYILAAASNPLVIVFTLPAMLLALLLAYFKHGWRHIVSPATQLVGLGIVAFLIRSTLFSSLAGADATKYISISSFAQRLDTIRMVYTKGFHGGIDHLLLLGVIVSILGIIGLWLFYTRQYFLSKRLAEPQCLTYVYLLTLPFAGTLALCMLLSLHEYYLWTTVVGSMLILLLAVPLRPPYVRFGAYGIAALVILGTLNPISLHRVAMARTRYYNTQPELTSCIDRNTTKNAVGYATFSDARHYGLTSKNHVLLIQISAKLYPANWLNNASYSKDITGTFFVVNPDTAEPPIQEKTTITAFGEPNHIARCGNVKLYFYTSQAQQKEIRTFYNAH